MPKEYAALARQALAQLLQKAALPPGELVVVGCSTSEIAGKRIGTAPGPAIAHSILQGLLGLLAENGLYLAAQCCEHLNRALVVERAALARHSLVQVNALPRPDAGGSFAAGAWQAMEAPVLARDVQAAAGLDIGATLIGMHLRPVAVPVRLAVPSIGAAPLTAAFTRPPYIGGPRAQYEEGPA